MKYLIDNNLSLLLGLLFVFTIGNSQPPGTLDPGPPKQTVGGAVPARPIAWVNGPGSTSTDWLPIHIYFERKYNILTAGSVGYRSIFSGQNSITEQTEEFLNIISESNRKTKILGIGHDMGGLVLRAAQLNSHSKNILFTGLILDGTPNQGSIFFRSILDVDVTQKSRMEEILNNVKKIRKASDCKDCGALELFEENIVNPVIRAPHFYEASNPNSNWLSQLQNPTVPYVVLWGNSGPFSITGLLDAGFPSNSNHLERCYEREFELARQDVEHAYFIKTAQRASGFLGRVLKVIAESKWNPSNNIGGLVSSIHQFMVQYTSDILSQLDDDYERNKALNQLTRCRLADDMLKAEVELMMMKAGTPTIETVNVLSPSPFEDCIRDCLDRAQDPHTGMVPPNAMAGCEFSCRNEDKTPVVSLRDVLKPEANDGILLKSEQLVPGAAATIELPETNHMEESHDQQARVIDELDDIFMGAAGAAFKLELL